MNILRSRSLRVLAFAFMTAATSACASAQAQTPPQAADMRSMIEHYEADREALRRFWRVEPSPQRDERLRAFFEACSVELEHADFDALEREARIDWLLLRHELNGELRQLALEAARHAETAPLVPFAPRIVALVEARQQMQELAPEPAAGELDALVDAVADVRKLVEEHKAEQVRTIVWRAAAEVERLRRGLDEWFSFRDGYDPEFSWWLKQPHAALHDALDGYARFLREDVAGVKADDKETIVGDPIGREALLAELHQALIPYSPEELIEIADRELAWCDERMLAASRKLGCGDDWKQALERVKGLHVAPGEQPRLIVDLAREACDFVERNALVTVPPLAKETWRMEMLSPERQRVSPFFLGGEVIQVSFPTDAMTHEEKLMSLRGNNAHFARATVFHELIPGHHLQQFMTRRERPYRRVFDTPFWTEGWALWWEMLLWERGWARGPEDEIGMLFWRMHRCARIKFSLSFHLGLMTPEQCIELLVERVGHERRNASAEVRRSFNGSYGPLYQIAYMVGALQLRALHAEVVGAGQLGEREFHDAVLQGGNMPIEMVRARLTDVPLTRDFEARWRFYPLER